MTFVWLVSDGADHTDTWTFTEREVFLTPRQKLKGNHLQATNQRSKSANQVKAMQILWSHAAIKPNALVVLRKSIRSTMKACNIKYEHSTRPFGNTDTLPMDEVCGAVHRVYDPSRFVS